MSSIRTYIMVEGLKVRVSTISLQKRISGLMAFGFTAAIVLMSFPGQVRAFEVGDGSISHPYLITSCVQLQSMNDDRSASYALAADIDCSDTVNWNEGAGFVPVGDCWGPGFAGTFDGKRHTISNLTINRPTTDRQALFGCTNDDVTIKNVGMVNVQITGQRYAGGIVGVLVGANSSIRDSYVTGNVELVLGDVMGSGQFAGGLVSGMEGGSHIYTSYSAADVSTFYHDAWGEGGISGYAYNDSTVVDSFWDTETPSTVLLTEGGGTGKTTEQMKTASTFTDAGWDFEHTWKVDENVNNGYPSFISPVDSDGIDTTSENAAPNTGDANGDTILDSEQSNVSSTDDPVTGSYMTLESTCESNSNVQIGAEPTSEQKDPAYDYPSGLVGFRLLNCGSDGVTATVTQYYYGNFDAANFVLRKWNGSDAGYVTVPGAVFTNVTIGGQKVLKVVYQITDGSSLDGDGQLDGNITDPSGPALAVVAAPNTGLGRR